MRFEWRIALKDLRRERTFSIFFTLTLMLGFLGFSAIELMKNDIAHLIEARSRLYLGSDISVSGRRALSESEENVMNSIPGIERSRMTELYTMLRSARGARLMSLRAVDNRFPFYGSLVAKGNGRWPGQLHQEKVVWVYPEVLDQLEVKVGDQLMVGEAGFRIEAVIEKDPGNSLGRFELAPRVYLSERFLNETGLLQKGSTSWHSRLLKVADNEALQRTRKTLATLLSVSDLRVATHEEAAQAAARPLKYLGDYLGLIALIALFLSGIGTTYLIFGYFKRKLPQYAVFRSLGMTTFRASRILVMQLAFLGALAGVTALALSYAAWPFVRILLVQNFDLEPKTNLPLSPLVFVLVMCLVYVALMTVPFLAGIRRVSLQELLLEGRAESFRLIGRDRFWLLLPFLFFGVMSVLQSRSLRTGGFFFLGLVVSLALFYGFGRLQLALLRFRPRHWLTRFSFVHLKRQPFSTLSAFVSLSLSVMFFVFVFHLERTFQSELSPEKQGARPSLFLFDIQEDQTERLLGLLKTEEIKLMQMSPMVRARLIRVNDETAASETDGDSNLQTREDEEGERFSRRGYNLSYRESLTPSESITDGKIWSAPYQGRGTPEVSVEVRYAERLKWKLGDRLEFDVQGVPVEGVITSFRRVNWSSFQPNFFVQFQPGVLEDAPQSFIASLPELPAREKSRVQTMIAREFSNVSVVDVTRVLNTLAEMVSSLSLSVKVLALLCVVCALFVFYALARFQAYDRREEVNMLRILGASEKQSARALWQETLWISGAAAVSGVALSFFLIFIIRRQVFPDFMVHFHYAAALLAVVATPIVATMIGYLLARRLLRAIPSQVLFDQFERS